MWVLADLICLSAVLIYDMSVVSFDGRSAVLICCCFVVLHVDVLVLLRLSLIVALLCLRFVLL